MFIDCNNKFVTQIYFLMSSSIFYMFYVVQVMWLGMYSYVYYADNSHNLSIQSLFTLCTFNSFIRLIRSELFINFVVFPGKILTFSRNSNVRCVRLYVMYCTGDMAWHVYLACWVCLGVIFLTSLRQKCHVKIKAKCQNFLVKVSQMTRVP